MQDLYHKIPKFRQRLKPVFLRTCGRNTGFTFSQSLDFKVVYLLRLRGLGTHSQKRTRCNKSVELVTTTCYNKPISGCVRMACDSLLTTSLL